MISGLRVFLEPFFLFFIDGEKITMMEPEPIHTYTKWKELGYQVQKGEKAITSFMIWKYAIKKGQEQEQESKDTESNENKGKMFMKKASFFLACRK